MENDLESFSENLRIFRDAESFEKGLILGIKGDDVEFLERVQSCAFDILGYSAVIAKVGKNTYGMEIKYFGEQKNA